MNPINGKDSTEVDESNENSNAMKLNKDLKENDQTKIRENLKEATTNSRTNEQIENTANEMENTKNDEISEAVDSKEESEQKNSKIVMENEKEDGESKSKIENVNENDDSLESQVNGKEKNRQENLETGNSGKNRETENSQEAMETKKCDENLKENIETENSKETLKENIETENSAENVKENIETGSNRENVKEHTETENSEENVKENIESENSRENVKENMETEKSEENLKENSETQNSGETLKENIETEKNKENMETKKGDENPNECIETENSVEHPKENIESGSSEGNPKVNVETANNEENIETSNYKCTEKFETESEANDFEDSNRETSIVSEPATEDETEEYENVEDVEIPGEEDVDEIIMPDEAEAEDLTDGKDLYDEMQKSQNDEAEDEEEQSLRESDVEEDNESEINLNVTEEHEEDEEEEEETTKSSEVAEREEEDDDDGDGDVDNASDKKSLNNDTKDDTTSKSFEESDNLVVLDEITNAESCMEQTKTDQANLDEDTITQDSYDPLNCADNNKDDGDDENIGAENSNESHKTLEKETNDDEVSSTKNIESGNENSVESESQKNDENGQNDEEEDEDDEVQFVETRNSPICIESDDDDDDHALVNTNPAPSSLAKNNNNSNSNKNDNNSRRIITTATTTVTVPRNIIVTRTSARKSTAKPPQTQQPRTSNNSSAVAAATIVPQIQNRTKSFNLNHTQKSYTFNKQTFSGPSAQEIIDCIELLDSSDDESSSKPTRPRKPTQQQQRTPQKRTLLAAKGNFYKNSNNSKVASPAVNRLPHNFTPQIRQQPKKPAPPPLPPPTPQSNFLNAVQLQPATVTGANPPAFSALLSNKNVIIPNAFYGNPPNIRQSSSETETEKRSVRWLENFLNQFCKPQFEPTHSCFVFLQRALKYKDFVRIKALRASMNNHLQNATNQLNIELMTDLKTIFFKNVKRITNYGQRFCELTCTASNGKTVTLMTHRLTGKVTLKTCNMELPKPINSSNTSANAAASSTQAGTNSTTTTRKRQLDEDEDEYTPDKSLYKTKAKPPSENGDDDSTDTGDERKRSLRTKRTKRIDNSFSYNEDDLLAEYEIDDADDEKLAQVEIQRKIEEKRLEAQKQRQQQAKSFESAFIQAFAKSLDAPTTSTTTKTKKNSSIRRIRLNNTPTATVTNIKQHTANNDAEDLLQATWIENDNTQIISDDDEPQEHRIYKQQQELQQQQQQKQLQQQQQQEYYKLPSNLTVRKSSGRATKRTAPSNRNIPQEEFITGDDDYEENNYYVNNTLNTQPLYWPKNVDPQMTVSGKSKDRCIICSLNCQRLVHHYVNEHRGCETYNSRLSATQVKKLKQGNCTASVSLYKNGQNLYEAFCIFCNKISRFMLRYWYQHYTMHTGEYAYRCTGCGVRKPTQSLLTLHHSQGCPQLVGSIVQDYTYDPKSTQIEAQICSLCNYVQLHRVNIVKHLRTQHNIIQILPKHIVPVVLMKIPAQPATILSSAVVNTTTYNITRRSSNSRSSAAAAASTGTFLIEDDDDGDDSEMNYEEILPEETPTQQQQQEQQQQPENHYYNYIPPYMQAAFNSGNLTFENVDAGEDLSYMICGMLDVQMDTTNEAN